MTHPAVVDGRLAVLLGRPGTFAGFYRDLLAVPGKRLRSGIALACTELVPGGVGDIPAADLLDLACAIEMLHDASLVHDDVCDGSTLRRGVASAPARHGVRFSARAGFHLAGTALRLLAEVLGRHPAVIARMVETREHATYVDRIGALSEGQIVEGLPPTTDPDALQRHYRAVAAAKTGTLFRLACSYGGVVGGCDRLGLRALMRYADHLSIAFQIMDDVRDCEGGPGLGKAAGTDLHRSIPTWPVIEWLRTVPRDAGSWADGSAEALRADIVASGATEQARLVAAAEVRAAQTALDRFPDTAGRRHLLELGVRVAR